MGIMLNSETTSTPLKIWVLALLKTQSKKRCMLCKVTFHLSFIEKSNNAPLQCNRKSICLLTPVSQSSVGYLTVAQVKNVQSSEEAENEDELATEQTK